MALCSIGFAARHYGVSASTIRRWAAKGLLTVARRTLGGHRRFELDNSCACGDADCRDPHQIAIPARIGDRLLHAG